MLLLLDHTVCLLSPLMHIYTHTHTSERILTVSHSRQRERERRYLPCGLSSLWAVTSRSRGASSFSSCWGPSHSSAVREAASVRLVFLQTAGQQFVRRVRKRAACQSCARRHPWCLKMPSGWVVLCCSAGAALVLPGNWWWEYLKFSRWEMLLCVLISFWLLIDFAHSVFNQ